MSLTKEIVIESLIAKFGDSIKLDAESLDLPAVVVDSKVSYALIKYLKEDSAMNFNFMTDVCGAHYPHHATDAQFSVVYHLHNWMANVRIRVKVFLDGENPTIKSVSDLYLSANWQERETYDFYGIEFTDHPDLRRILNMDEMESFPMRKEFPMEDPGRTDKDDRYFGRLPQTNNITNN